MVIQKRGDEKIKMRPFEDMDSEEVKRRYT
jgi:hypothetical protein